MTRDNQNKIPATLKRSLNVSACPTKIKKKMLRKKTQQNWDFYKKKKRSMSNIKSYFSDHIKKVLGYTADKEVQMVSQELNRMRRAKTLPDHVIRKGSCLYFFVTEEKIRQKPFKGVKK